jgi:hypothetical protein
MHVHVSGVVKAQGWGLRMLLLRFVFACSWCLDECTLLLRKHIRVLLSAVSRVLVSHTTKSPVWQAPKRASTCMLLRRFCLLTLCRRHGRWALLAVMDGGSLS